MSLRDKPAFPSVDVTEIGDNGSSVHLGPRGMTLREHYAGRAMQGLAAFSIPRDDGDSIPPPGVAILCVALADALLAELEKPK